MYQQSFAQSPAGSQSKPPTCYNCGAGDHFMIACPEQARQIPAGLAAARAAQAAQTSEAVDNGQSGYGNRPFKRQKTGPVVTRFPAPPTGPVITHYASPPAQAAPYSANTDSYYGGPLTQPYQQQHGVQSQPYTPHVPSQQGMHYSHFPAQHTPNVAQGYVQAPMPTAPQGYGQFAPNMPQVYGQPITQSMSQYGFQNSYGAPYQEGYPTGPMPRPHGNDPSMRYGQPSLAGQPSQIYPPYQSQAPFNEQPFAPYQGPSPAQSYGPSIPAQGQTGIQTWNQPPPIAQTYPAPAYQSGNTQYQQPYQNQYKKRPYHHIPVQPSQFGTQRNPQNAGKPSPSLFALQQGYSPPKTSHNFQRSPGRPRSFSVSNLQPGSTDLSSQPSEVEEAKEAAEFQWNLEKIFANETKKESDPIGRPLPTVYDEEPIPPPAYNTKAIVSKYVRPNNLEIFARDIRLSLHWPSLKADPVFNDIDFDSPLIRLDAIESWIQQRQNRLDLTELSQNGSQPSPTLKRAWMEGQGNDSKKMCPDTLLGLDASRSPYAPHGGMDGAGELARPERDVTPVVDRSTTPAFGRSATPSFGADDDAWAPQPGEGQTTISPVTDPTEVLLASLGVTGSPKPIATKNPGLLTSPTYVDETSQDFYSRVPVRHDSGYASQRGSISHEGKNGSDYPTPYSEYRQSYNGSNPPPPPPPPPHMRRQVDGALDSPSSDGSGQFRIGTAPYQHEVQSSGAHQDSSPLTPTSAEGNGHEYTMTQERKVVAKPVPLRQVDDVTPKLKRRQPKVADAYSRRW